MRWLALGLALVAILLALGALGAGRLFTAAGLAVCGWLCLIVGAEFPEEET